MNRLRPYFREVRLNPQQENQAMECVYARNMAYNFTINYRQHLWYIYIAYLEAHHAKKKSDLNSVQKNEIKKLFPSYQDVRNYFKRVYMELPRQDQVYTWCNKIQWMLSKDIPRHTLEYGIKTAIQAEDNWHFHGARRPHHKGNYSRISLYFDGAIHVYRNGIRLPRIGFIRLVEKGSVPTDKQLNNQDAHIKEVYLSGHAGHWHTSVVTSELQVHCYIPHCQLHGHLGIDVGIKSEAIINALNGYQSHWFENISKSKKYKRLVVHKHVWQNRMSRRPIQYHKNQHTYDKKHFRPKSKGYFKAKAKFAAKCRQISNLTKGYLRKIAYQIIQRKPKSITIEHLNINGMLKNHKLAKAISRCNWGYFYKWLMWLCRKYGVELRQVSRYYPSTKVCHLCGHYDHSQFKGNPSDLKVRNMYCHKYHQWFDRDLNAAINLAKAKKYKVLVNPVF